MLFALLEAHKKSPAPGLGERLAWELVPHIQKQNVLSALPQNNRWW